MDLQLQLELCILMFVLILTRIFYLIHKATTGYSRIESKKRSTPCKTLICIGSGGHTTEMLTLLKNLSFNKYTPRLYFVAKSDITSAQKIEELEKNKQQENNNCRIIKIPRSRIVGQSYITSVFTTMYSILYCIPIVLRERPDLVLCNGPGTCVPICVICFFMKMLFIKDTHIVFIESFCRTQTLSLTGKILKYFADNFIVQWPSLKKKIKRAEYIGQLM